MGQVCGGGALTILEIILVTLLAVSLVLLAVVLIYFKYFRIYTREKFAFRVFLLVASLIASLIFLIISGGGTATQILSFFAKLIGIQSVDFQPTLSDKLLAVVLILALIYLAVKLHRNWPGAISTREHEASLMGLRPGLVSGTIAAVADLSGKAPLQTYSPSRPGFSPAEILLSPTETKAWHHWVARILKISSNHMHIDELKDWFADRRMYLSSYGVKRMPIGILCWDRRPSTDEILEQIDFVTEQSGHPLKLIVAIDADQGTRITTQLKDIDIEFRYKNELLDSLVDFSRYKDDIIFRFDVSEIAEGYLYKLPDVYVASSSSQRF